VTEGWTKLHNEELHNLHTSPNIIRMTKSNMMRWAHMGEIRNAYKILVSKPEGKRPLGRPRYRREDNIKMGLKKWGGKV
jgi:hypothetical protein